MSRTPAPLVDPPSPSHAPRRRPAITRPGDAAERRADALADAVLRAPAPVPAELRRQAATPAPSGLAREAEASARREDDDGTLAREAATAASREEEEPLAREAATAGPREEEEPLAREAATAGPREEEEPLAREAATDGPREEEEPLAREAAASERREDEDGKLARQAGTATAGGGGAAAAVAAANAPGRPLAPEQRSFFEPRLGRDLGGVRVHTDTAAGEAARGIDAHAYAHGSDVVFAPGRYAPSTTSGRRLLAHELAHVVQEPSTPLARQAATAAPAPPAPSAPAVAPPLPAPPSLPGAPAGVPAEAVELQGAAAFAPPQGVADYLAQQPRAAPVRVRFGSLAAGVVNVQRRGDSYETPGDRHQQLPLVHPGLAPIASLAEPVLAIRIREGRVDGYVSLAVAERAAPQRRGLLELIERNPAAMGWLGLDRLRLDGVTNQLENGTLRLGISGLRFRLGGYIDGSGAFALENEAVTFQANATIHVRGLTDAQIQISRDPQGRLAGHVEVPVSFARFSGNVTADYLDGVVDVQGMARYETEKLTGQVTLLVTDAATARDVARARLGPDAMAASAQETARPEGAGAGPVPGPRAVAGWGELDFRFSDWLTGKAQVIVDGEGHITVVGEITPPASVELFAQRDWVRQLPRLEARALYGVPLVGNVFVFANIGIDALAKLGPGTLYDIRVEGTYSTDPLVFNRFSISGRLNISAFAGLRLRGEGGVGIELLDHDIKVGVGINALAGVRGYVEAMPTVGFREVEDPLAGRKGEFFLRGHLELAAQPFLGLGGDLFVQLDSPWWSPAPDKTWTWPLGDLEYPLPGQLGIGADIEYVIGSGELPDIQFSPVDFNAERFMTDLMSDHVPPKRAAAAEQQGAWQETAPDAAAAAAGAAGDPQLADTAGAPAVASAQGQGGAPPSAESAAQAGLPAEQPTPEVVKAAALGDVEDALKSGTLHTTTELDGVIDSIFAKHRAHGLKSLDVDVPDENSMDLQVTAAASDPQRRTIAWADVFAADNEIRGLFEHAPRYETHAAISVNGALHGEVVASNRDGHAEENLVSNYWNEVLDLVRSNASNGVRSVVILAINRAPCYGCSALLSRRLRAVNPAALKAEFILAPTGTYEPTENLTDEEIKAAEAAYRVVADRLRAAGREVQGYDVVSRAELLSHGTKMQDLHRLSDAGWDIRQLAVRPRETSAGVVLAEAAHKVAVRAGRVKGGSG